MIRAIHLLIAALMGLVCLEQYHLWFRAEGIRDLWAIKSRLRQQTMENKQLREENAKLMLTIQSLKTDPAAIETQARHELGMIKQDEKFYQIVK